MKISVLSPWLAHRARKRGTVIDTIVMHATAGSSLIGAIETLQERGLSYHYLIEKDGTTTKCVPYQSCAFHAGASVGPQGKACNEYSIGISFVNMNNGKDPYTKEQSQAATDLIVTLRGAIPGVKWITTHYWISPGRKDDPKGFDIGALAEATSLSLWKPK